MGSIPIRVASFASVAQLVEQGTENPRVIGSIPIGGTINADLAHLVERHLAKVEVASSSLVIRSIFTPALAGSIKEIRRGNIHGVFCYMRILRSGSARRAALYCQVTAST